MIYYFLDLFGTAVFAISGVLLAFRAKMDAVGVIVLASFTAIGGGTIRDTILNLPVFWLSDNNYIWLIIATCLLTIWLINKANNIPWWILPVSDAIGLAFFAIMGTEKTLDHGFSPTVAVLMGAITGCGGGAIRDVFARIIPFIFQKEIYATACIIGSTAFCLLEDLNLPRSYNFLISICIVLTIRLSAIKWNLSLPIFEFEEKGKKGLQEKKGK